MKEGSGVFVIQRQQVAAVSPSAAFMSPVVGGFQTPSPFSFSVASSRWSSSRPSIHVCSLVLRGMVLVFSFASSLALVVNNRHGFEEYTEFIYSVVVTTLVFFYTLYQLFKGIREISCINSDKISDYISFIVDQLACYLVVSSSSVTAVTIHQQLNKNTSLYKAAIVSVCMSVVALLATAATAILSGYKLSKRIMW